MEGLVIFSKLLCAHLCADFLLQSDKISKGKRQKGLIGALFLLLHCLIQASCAYLFVANWSEWRLPTIIFISHGIFDWIKCRIASDTAKSFLIDQFCHIAVIAAISLVMFAEKDTASILIERLAAPNVWLTIAAYMLMLKPSSILLNLFLKKWAQETSAS